MPTLSNAPLVEVWTQLRWGEAKKDEMGNLTEFSFPMEDTDFFPGQFRDIAKQAGFSHVERVNPQIPPIAPHVVTYRFRREPNSWPCYQIGLGIFTVNQVNDGYSWNKFKGDAIEGLKVLDKGHPLGLEKLNGFGIELRYRDGFLLREGQTPLAFLSDNFKIGFLPPRAFLDHQHLGSNISGMRLGFSLNLLKPLGELVLEISQGIINGKPGLVMDTIVRSHGEKRPDFTFSAIADWLEDAHSIQRHAFMELIDPVFARTFK